MVKNRLTYKIVKENIIIQNTSGTSRYGHSREKIRFLTT